jgi:hypothetical protein
MDGAPPDEAAAFRGSCSSPKKHGRRGERKVSRHARLTNLTSSKNRYGTELGRLAAARALARQGQESARRGVAPLVLEDITVSIETCFLESYLWILLGSWRLG